MLAAGELTGTAWWRTRDPSALKGLGMTPSWRRAKRRAGLARHGAEPRAHTGLDSRGRLSPQGTCPLRMTKG